MYVRGYLQGSENGRVVTIAEIASVELYMHTNTSGSMPHRDVPKRSLLWDGLKRNRIHYKISHKNILAYHIKV